MTEFRVKLAELERKVMVALSQNTGAGPIGTMDVSGQRNLEVKMLEVEKKINEMNLSVVMKVEQQNTSM